MDSYHKLKISAAILQRPIKQIAKDAGCSEVALRGVCYGDITSARISEFLDELYHEADERYRHHRQKKSYRISAQ